MTSRRTLLKAAAAACLPASVSVRAQGFPSKTVTIVVPFAPGGPTDQLARALAGRMQEGLGKPVIVENRPGAGGQIAATAVRQAEADGHAIFIGATEMFAINPTLYRKFSYEPAKDFQPLAAIAQMPMILVVPKASPANSLGELLALAKTKPGGLSYASQGPGSIGHLLGEMVRAKTGLSLNHVPYKGSAPALQDLVGGQVDLMFDVILSTNPLIQSDRLKALAVASAARTPPLPAVPTMTEGGLAGTDASVWFGAVVKAGTPEPIVARLNEAMNAAIASPEVSKKFGDLGLQMLRMTPAQFGAFMRAETDRWTPVVKASGASVE
ncbi:MAG: tripartite tricarboxylate transporter substrate binding protein [Burkholderiales bacterium]